MMSSYLLQKPQILGDRNTTIGFNLLEVLWNKDFHELFYAYCTFKKCFYLNKQKKQDKVFKLL